MTRRRRHPARIPLYGWLTAEAISLLGTRVSMIAIPWLVLTTTGSPTQTGLVAFAEITPMVLFKASGGPLVDRVGPAPDGDHAPTCSRSLVVGLIPVLHHAGAAHLPAPARPGRDRAARCADRATRPSPR